MNITISIQAPELVGAINNLAASLGGKLMAAAAPTPQNDPQQAAAAFQQPPMQLAYGAAPTPAVPTQSAVPVTPAQAPAAPAPTAPVGVPTAAPAYTFEQLGVAAGPIVDAGRSGELTSWLQQHGANTLMELPKELYGEFATYLRSLGAKI
ncbi:hypothetical protein WJ0W_004717 [Paenibacillus melissococcoides]|uniref:Uncharacterized protein n=1 Tax=Paenibacillus melissococcoides TaxID=2912268 RepID=A0ABN8U8M7_9BACL|nr:MULTISPECIES: hypothetical protein [Paenibacillus]MEB9896369.1 hypothetical protein [Bacillus cereus]QVQ56235.1 hypothetical protein [Paenibacillus phage Pd_22F]CAH8247482.1 hypothetical protein WJ0W_004717 [Paenibacillus melissococcoides]CAH8705118.1 hypothetical protein HTL2_000801 [Paenibacillus melissococcoides]CAH8714530.1 hypothetical protein WDD9_003921 [Paenibacillus melissococcoides]